MDELYCDIDDSLFPYCMKKRVLADVANKLTIRTVYEVYANLDDNQEGNLIIAARS